MNATSDIITPEKRPRLDAAAVLLLGLMLAVSVLYPENFISGVLFFGSGNINPLNMIMPVIVIVSIVYLVARRGLIRPVWADAFVVMFTVYLLFRNISGETGLLTAKYVVVGLSAFYLTALLAAGRKSMLMFLLYAIVGLTLVTVVYGLVEYTLQDNFIYGGYVGAIVAEPASGIHRIGSSIGHPVAYGAFLIQALPFAVLLWFVSKARWQRVLAMTTLFTGILALFLTYSKGSWIVAVLLAAAAIILGRGTNSRRFLRPAILILLVVAAATAFFWQEIKEEVEGRSFSSVNVRLKAWNAAADAIEGHPVTGVGIRLGADEIVKYVDPVWYAEWDRQLPIDNYYLTLLVEEGLAGFILMMGAVFLILRECVVLARRQHSAAWALAALASIVGLLLNAITFDALHIWPNYVLFWMAAGMAHGLFWQQAAKVAE